MGFITFVFTVLTVALFVLFLSNIVPVFVLYLAVGCGLAAAGFGAVWASRP